MNERPKLIGGNGSDIDDNIEPAILEWVRADYPGAALLADPTGERAQWQEWAAQIWDAVVSMLVGVRGARELGGRFPLEKRTSAGALLWLGDLRRTVPVQIRFCMDGGGMATGWARITEEMLAELMGAGWGVVAAEMALSEDDWDRWADLGVQQGLIPLAELWGAAGEAFDGLVAAGILMDEARVGGGQIHLGAEFHADRNGFFGRRVRWTPADLAPVADYPSEAGAEAAVSILESLEVTAKRGGRRWGDRWQIEVKRGSGMGRSWKLTVGFASEVALLPGTRFKLVRGVSSGESGRTAGELMGYLRALSLTPEIERHTKDFAEAANLLGSGLAEVRCGRLQPSIAGQRLRDFLGNRWSDLYGIGYAGELRERLAAAAAADPGSRERLLVLLLRDLGDCLA